MRVPSEVRPPSFCRNREQGSSAFSRCSTAKPRLGRPPGDYTLLFASWGLLCICALPVPQLLILGLIP